MTAFRLPHRRMMAAGSTLCVAWALPAVADTPRERLGNMLSRLPTTGAIEVTATPLSGTRSVSVAGYDFASGCWYYAHTNAIFGIEPSGRSYFRATAKPQSLIFNPTDDRLEDASALRTLFPWVQLDLLRRDPSRIIDVSSTDTGLVVRTRRRPPGKDSIQANKEWVLVLKIDSGGLVVEVGTEPDPVATAILYTYEESFDGPLPLAAKPFRIESRNWNADATKWTAEYVIEHARAVGVAPLSREPMVPPLLPANAGDQDPADARWSRTFLITGAVVCAVGVFAWIRARRRA